MLHENGGQIPFGKAVSALAYEFGLTKEKIIEHLKIHEDLDRFVLDFEKNRICNVTLEDEKSD